MRCFFIDSEKFVVYLQYSGVTGTLNRKNSHAKIDFIIFNGLGVLLRKMLHAQDPQFSQFYAAPLYINPAFTGASEYT